GAQCVPRRAERLQPGEPRGPDVQLQLLAGTSSGLFADHPEPRHSGRILMRTSTFVRVGIVAASAALLWSACGGAGFEPSSKIKGLRVLALQKEPAYPHPGETVDLKLLYWDGKASDGSS